VSTWYPEALNSSLLHRSYKGKVNIATIIYLHRIIDIRMSGTLQKNLRMFRSVCGGDAMPNVVIATTMWSRVPDEEGAEREQSLMGVYWKEMIDEGCHVERFLDTRDSAWSIVDSLKRITSARNANANGAAGVADRAAPKIAESSRSVKNTKDINPAKVKISEEIVDHHLQLKRTEAGITLNDELKKLLQARKVASRKLRAQLKNQNNELVVQELNQQQAEIDERIEETAIQLKELNIPFTSQLLGFFGGGGRHVGSTKAIVFFPITI
jgi:hypothetical protein